MNPSDLFYEKVTENIRTYLFKHKREEPKAGVGQALEYFASLFGQTKYDQLARNFADIGLLVGGALKIQSRTSKGKLRKLSPDGAVIMDALKVYDNKRITPEAIANTLQLSYENFNSITGEDYNSFVGAVSSAYNSAMQEHGIVVPDKNPEDFLIKTVLRQKIHKNVREIEDVFLATTRDEWDEKVLNGDVSDYTIAVPVRLGQYDTTPAILIGQNNEVIIDEVLANLGMIDELTELPIFETTLERDKDSFPVTREYKILTDNELKEIITSGMNKYLDMFEAYSKQLIEIYDDSLREDSVRDYGINGYIFNVSDLGGIEYIVLNDEMTIWDGGGQHDENSWYSPKDFLGKIKILDSDGYIDFNRLSEWPSSAVNEYITGRVTYLTNFFESGNYEEYRSWFSDAVEKLKKFSLTAEKFVAEESKNSLDAFEKRLKEEI